MYNNLFQCHHNTQQDTPRFGSTAFEVLPKRSLSCSYCFERMNKFLYMLMMLLMYNHCQNSIRYKKILDNCVGISLGTRILFSIILGLSLADYS